MISITWSQRCTFKLLVDESGSCRREGRRGDNHGAWEGKRTPNGCCPFSRLGLEDKDAQYDCYWLINTLWRSQNSINSIRFLLGLQQLQVLSVKKKKTKKGLQFKEKTIILIIIIYFFVIILLICLLQTNVVNAKWSKLNISSRSAHKAWCSYAGSFSTGERWKPAGKHSQLTGAIFQGVEYNWTCTLDWLNGVGSTTILALCFKSTRLLLRNRTFAVFFFYRKIKPTWYKLFTDEQIICLSWCRLPNRN